MKPIFSQILVLVRGGGDLGSGVVYRLHQAGFPVVVTELAKPLCVRRAVSFASAVIDGTITVDGVTARLCQDISEIQQVIDQGEVPVLIDSKSDIVSTISPMVVVDARMVKHTLDTAMANAPLVIALGPGFEAGVDCHAVIETNRGHFLGRVFWQGQAEPDTGIPGRVNGIAAKRVLRAPDEGNVVACKTIGDFVKAGDVVVKVNDKPVVAKFDGVVRGLIDPNTHVKAGLKIGDIDPRATREHCFTISDKSLAIGGAVLEAVLSAEVVRNVIIHEAPQ